MKLFSRTALRIAAVLAVMLAAAAVNAQRWSVTEDGAPAANPNGPWQYGTLSLGGAFTPFSGTWPVWNDPALTLWQHPSFAGDIGPCATFNTANASKTYGSITYPPRSLTLHPWHDGTRAVVRFTAPAAGKYRVNAQFSARDFVRTTTDVHVSVNGADVFVGAVSRPNNLLTAFYTSGGYAHNLQAGDTIDFYVGLGPEDYRFDSTGLAAVVERVGNHKGRVVAWGDNPDEIVSRAPLGEDFVEVSASWRHAVALRADGKLFSWGSNDYLQVTNTPAEADFKAVSAGSDFTVAIRKDGSLAAWGRNDYNVVTNRPVGNDFVAVTASGYFATALRSNGTLVTWGFNGYGQITNTPAGNDFIEVHSTNAHAIALRFNGTVVTWGYNGFGQVSNTPTGGGFVDVAAGNYHSVAVRTDGSVVVWGQDIFGQIAYTPTTSTYFRYSEGPGTPAGMLPMTPSPFVSVTAGVYHSSGLRENGSIVTWGSNTSGCVNRTPTGTNLFAIAAGRWFGIALERVKPAPGSVVAWGPQVHPLVVNAPAGQDFIAASAGWEHNVALRSNGRIECWGVDTYGQLSGIPTTSDFIAIGAGAYHTLAIRSDHSLVAWGYDQQGQVSRKPAGNDFVMVSAGWSHSIALRSNGAIVSWGYDGNGQVTSTPSGTDFVYVAAGGNRSVAIRRNGTLAYWGEGAGLPPAGNDFVAASVGADHCIARRANGTVVSWGDNFNGVVSATPTTSGYAAVAAGQYHSVALSTAGSLSAWGDDEWHQVGFLPAGTGFIRVAGGRYGGVAIRDFTPTNSAPTANGGPNQTLTVEHDGDPVTNTTSVSLDGSVSIDPDPGDTLSFEWRRNGAVVSVTAQITEPLKAGTYTYTLKVTDSHGLSSTDTVTVTVLPEPNQAPAADAGPDFTVSLRPNGTDVVLAGEGLDPDDDPLTYAWYEGDSLIASEQYPTVLLTAGSHTLRLVVMDPYGATGEDTVVVRVADITPPDTIITAAFDFTGQPVSAGSSTPAVHVFIWASGFDEIGISELQYSLDGQPWRSGGTRMGFGPLTQATHTIRVRAVDSSGNIDPTPASFAFTVISPAQGIENLILLISQLVGLDPGEISSLQADLRQAADLLEDGNPQNDNAALNKLSAFVQKVATFRRNGRLNQSDSDLLFRMVSAIRNALGG